MANGLAMDAYWAGRINTHLDDMDGSAKWDAHEPPEWPLLWGRSHGANSPTSMTTATPLPCNRVQNLEPRFMYSPKPYPRLI